MKKIIPEIRMYTCDAESLTVEEYEALQREVMARIMADGGTKNASVGDRILARLLYEHGPRYSEAKMILKGMK